MSENFVKVHGWDDIFLFSLRNDVMFFSFKKH